MNTSSLNSITQTNESQKDMTPDMALELLKAGNQRFVENKHIVRDLPGQVKDTSTGQFPFAVILGCIDSRVPAELVFDQGIGDIFNTRIAGNFVNTDILGSLEFACKAAGSKLILVLGHTHCGAVKGACDDVQLGNLTSMLKNIKPAIDSIKDITENRTSSNKDFVQRVADKNVDLAIEDIRSKSEVLNEMESNGEIKIIGAMYDIHTGRVTFNA